MRQSGRQPQVKDTVMISGWIFADLLLALAVLFLAANTGGVKPHPIPTPTPIVVATSTPTPTLAPTQEPRLDFNSQRITLLNVDYVGLLNNSPQAINDVEQRIRAQPVLQNRSVGLAIVYGGAPTDNDIGQAFDVADKVYAILKELGAQGFAFQRSSYYVHLYTLGSSASTVSMDIYLFKK